MSNPTREIKRMMDKSAQQPQAVSINIGAGGATSGDTTHNHDDRYYREAEVDTLLSGKSDTTHNHDTDYAYIAHSHDSSYMLKQSGTLPTASEAYRGQMWTVEGGAGVADVMYACVKGTDDNYSWKVISLT